ncbi:ABC transporter ATP-binding protein [Halorussus aquaticus]|uniref:ABC transporter ATP-binding protein n=1 Tax=Halorussus aquaticus TaxID=2953748 RepID=A0ABD5Q044_9EURY|nr:oligopeptide/dipeptide ABC transporter ATP-binding protein [Halorussus aquaticus]
MTDSPSESLLSVRGLTKHYPVTEGPLRREVGRIRAVDGVDFEVERGETLGLVGESGCGKSTVATTLMGLEDPTAGRITFDGVGVADRDDADRREFRRRAGMVFQDPTSSFDPRMTVGESVAEPLAIHGLDDADRRREIVADLLERVGLSADDADRYPHEFSGGQKQRAALARSLVLNPDLLVADEPVSALDVSVQAGVLSLLDDLQREFDLAVLLISHDMAVVREICDRVAVMYLGEIVEVGPTESVLADPQHPYTRALTASVPRPDPDQRGSGVRLSGDVPSPADPPSGCRFHTRCPEVIPPEGYDFEQDDWRAVMDLRTALAADDFDTEGVRRSASAVRERFGLPEELPDSDAEAVVSEAIDSLTADDREAARRLLAEEFETVCETDPPDLRATEVGHPAACHLHDSAAAESPRAESDD